MHNSEIFYKVKCNETKNKRSDKSVEFWAESDLLVKSISVILG